MLYCFKEVFPHVLCEATLINALHSHNILCFLAYTVKKKGIINFTIKLTFMVTIKIAKAISIQTTAKRCGTGCLIPPKFMQFLQYIYYCNPNLGCSNIHGTSTVKQIGSMHFSWFCFKRLGPYPSMSECG